MQKLNKFFTYCLRERTNNSNMLYFCLVTGKPFGSEQLYRKFSKLSTLHVKKNLKLNSIANPTSKVRKMISDHGGEFWYSAVAFGILKQGNLQLFSMK